MIGRGCDNSANTGGAELCATGFASLAADTVVFTTDGEKPTALSVLVQGTTDNPPGVIAGQGIRCAGGQLKRLYVRSASNGSIHAPVTGEQSVSARSAAMGDPLGPGSVRHYFAYYRDPIVLGGCPVLSTFNVTQGGRIAWVP
jgi:hypothetical protein